MKGRILLKDMKDFGINPCLLLAFFESRDEIAFKGVD
jgi:hypothetical protein